MLYTTRFLYANKLRHFEQNTISSVYRIANFDDFNGVLGPITARIRRDSSAMLCCRWLLLLGVRVENLTLDKPRFNPLFEQARHPERSDHVFYVLSCAFAPCDL